MFFGGMGNSKKNLKCSKGSCVPQELYEPLIEVSSVTNLSQLAL
jgi:hypothetical protein